MQGRFPRFRARSACPSGAAAATIREFSRARNADARRLQRGIARRARPETRPTAAINDQFAGGTDAAIDDIWGSKA
jgi:hypothetical protein